MASVIESTDFTANALSDNSVTVVRTPITKTLDAMGDETLTAGSTNNVTAIISNRINKFTQEKHGLLEFTDGYLMVGPSETINKNDLITYDGISYRVINVRVRGPSGGTAFYKFCELQRTSSD